MTGNPISSKNEHNLGLSQLLFNGKMFDGTLDIANHMNDFFVNVGPELDKNIPNIDHISPNKYLRNRNHFTFVIANISHDDVLEILHSLPNKGTGPSSIPIKMLNAIVDLIVIPLCDIINTSFNTGVFPDLLKIAYFY